MAGKYWKFLALILICALIAGCGGKKAKKTEAGEEIIDVKTYDADTLRKDAMALDGYLEELVDNFLVIYDATGSKYVPYRGRIKLRLIRETITRFNEKVPDRPLTGGLRRLGFEAGAFTKKTELINGMGHYSRNAYLDAIESVKWAGGKTPMWIGINAASKDMIDTVGYAALVIFSDGKINDEDPFLAKIIMELEFNPKLERKFKSFDNNPILGDIMMELDSNPELAGNVENFARAIMRKENDPDSIKKTVQQAPSLARRFRKLDNNLVTASKIMYAAAKAVNAFSVQSAKNMKQLYGDRLCIYTVQIGDLPFGKMVLEKVAEAGGCGYYVNADELGPDKNLTDFADDVFTRRHRFGQPPPDKSRGDRDSDGDGVPDSRDKCPGTPKGAKVDEDGCWILEKVQFDLNKWNIKPEYFRVCDDVARVLKLNPGLKIEIHGHTCNIWTEKYNMNLSHWRALSVTSYLLKKGVASSQLAVKGFGYHKPFMSNRTDEGRSLNRRAEFHPIR